MLILGKIPKNKSKKEYLDDTLFYLCNIRHCGQHGEGDVPFLTMAFLNICHKLP